MKKQKERKKLIKYLKLQMEKNELMQIQKEMLFY